MGKLTDILADGGFGADDFSNAWQNTEAADEYKPLPPGEYVCHADRGELKKARTGTPSYSLSFKVCEGEHTGRLVWLDLFLTPAALPMAKRDLVKLGIDSPEKLELPLPQGIRCKVKVALRKDDDGSERNRVVRFFVVGIDKPEVDAFAPVSAVAHDERPTNNTASKADDERGRDEWQ